MVDEVDVPGYDELSVKSLWPEFKKDANFCSYFPAVFPKGKGPPRDYFFNILNTMYPEYLKQVMQHANEQRMSADAEGNRAQSIAMTEFWANELKSMPFLSSKFISLSNYLILSLCP